MPKKRPSAPIAAKPPVVTIMGHIDHGKTTLLDALRKSSVAAKESGGITQHIGAYQVEFKNQKITFIDTPGHAAFAAMRSRGAQATDLAVLVIDAVESVKPQTKESLEHIKLAGVPFLVAVNKMDLPNAHSAVVKKDLADAGVMVEGYGGDIVCVEVSAKTGKNLDQLLEMILLVAEMQALNSKPLDPLHAVVIESSMDKNRGPIATVIVKAGTLRIGDSVSAGEVSGKIKALFDGNNQSIKTALPGDPAAILGFQSVPVVGSVVTAITPHTKTALVTPKALTDEEAEVESKKLKVIVKADVAGTLEAVVANLGGAVAIVSQSLGDITESDVLLAQSSRAVILAFRVKPTASSKKLAEIEKVRIISYNLIYELLEDMQQQALKLLEPTIDEEVLGEAKVVAEFTAGGQKIAGCLVTSGKITVNNSVHLMRGDALIADSKIKSIKIGKVASDKAKNHEECGLSFNTPLDFKPKDKLVAYKTL